MWPGCDSRSRRRMWVEFVVSSRPCSEGFSPGTPVFLPPQKPTLCNFVRGFLWAYKRRGLYPGRGEGGGGGGGL